MKASSWSWVLPIIVATCLAPVSSLWPVGGAWSARKASSPSVDFNGDGFGDLAIGVIFEDLEGPYRKDTGAMHVLYGTSTGLSTAGAQFWTQDTPGIEDRAEDGDHFSSALVAGDFNGDGYRDLAASAYEEGIGTIPGAGAVHITYGSAIGLAAAGNQFWHQNSPDIIGRAEPFDYFGRALAAGDFNGDGYADLAIGISHEDLEIQGRREQIVVDAGAVNVLYGSPGGLAAGGNQEWSQESVGIEGEAESYDFFGIALATGDLNGDGLTDLAIGVIGDPPWDRGGAGAVNVLYGSPAGLSAAGSQYWNQDSEGIKDRAEAGDGFGRFLSSGDFNGDSFADLVVSVPHETYSRIRRAGAVNVLYGSSAGLLARQNQFWTQNTPGVRGIAEPDDWFGSEFTSGDFNGDGIDDLAVGVPEDRVDAFILAGAVNVLYGSLQGLTVAGNQRLTQDTAGVKGNAEETGFFGASVAAGDFDGDGILDLAAGSGIDIEGISGAGAVNVLRGAHDGITERTDQLWHQNRAGIADYAEWSDYFGSALSAAR